MSSLQPGYKPSLVMIFAYLGDIYAERHQTTNRKTDLDQAIWATQWALSISTPDHPINTTLLNNLANLLWRCYRCSEHEVDLRQALFYGLQALDSLAAEKSDRAAVLGALGAIRASLYDCHGDFQDLQEAMSITRRSIDIATRYAGTAPTILFNNLGAYLWTQYCLTSRREDLDESIISFSKALECPTDKPFDRVACLINSGQALAQRYNRTGQLEDLSCALENAQEAMQLGPQNVDLAILLKRLDRFLDRRREPTAPVHRSQGHWNARHESRKLLLLFVIFISIVVIYICNPRTELLLSMIAFPSGILYHWITSRKATAGKKITMEDALAPVSSLKERFDFLGDSNEYTPKLLAVPLISVPFASSLRGIETSDFSMYSSSSYNQRRKSIQSVNSERQAKRQASLGYQKNRNEKVHGGRHRGHRHASPRRERDRIPTIAVTTPNAFVRCESPKESISPVVRDTRPPIGVDFTRDGIPLGRRRETHVVPLLRNESSMQRSFNADSGYGSSSVRQEAGMDMQDHNEEQNIVSADEQRQQLDASTRSYSQPASPKDANPAEQIASALAPSQNLWAEPGSEYTEHKIWDEPEEQESRPGVPELEQVRVVRQGHTKLEMGTNSGLAMGNVTSTRAEVAGHVRYEVSQSERQHSYHERMCKTSKSDDVQDEIVLQEDKEEEEIVPVPEVSDFEGTSSLDSVPIRVHVQEQASVTSIVENLWHSQQPRVEDVEEEDVEQEDSNIDLVDQLARQYLESSSL